MEGGCGPIMSTDYDISLCKRSVNKAPEDDRGARLEFSDSEKLRIQNLLQQKLTKEDIAERAGPGNAKLNYVESWRTIEIANDVFGYNGWNCSILTIQQEHAYEQQNRWYFTYSAIVRVQLKDGTSHEDIGFGQSEGFKDKGKSIEKAKKAAVSDARKRCLRLFGERLGNSVYDKMHLKEVKRAKLQEGRPLPPSCAAQATAVIGAASGIHPGGFGPQSIPPPSSSTTYQSPQLPPRQSAPQPRIAHTSGGPPAVVPKPPQGLHGPPSAPSSYNPRNQQDSTRQLPAAPSSVQSMQARPTLPQSAANPTSTTSNISAPPHRLQPAPNSGPNLKQTDQRPMSSVYPLQERSVNSMLPKQPQFMPATKPGTNPPMNNGVQQVKFLTPNKVPQPERQHNLQAGTHSGSRDQMANMQHISPDFSHNAILTMPMISGKVDNVAQPSGAMGLRQASPGVPASTATLPFSAQPQFYDDYTESQYLHILQSMEQPASKKQKS